MSYKAKAILLSIVTLVLAAVAILLIPYAFQTNILLGIMSLFLISVPGSTYNKAVSNASKSGSKFLHFFVKVIVVLLMLAIIFVGLWASLSYMFGGF